MHIAFVDESGDVGLRNSPTRHFVLCAALIDHMHWAAVNQELRAMRERLLAAHGLRLDAEIHASQFLGGSPLHLGLDIRRRFQCAHHVLRTLATLQGVAYRRVAVMKSPNATPILDAAWGALLADLDQGIKPRPSGGCPSQGMLIICDHHAALPYRPKALAIESMGLQAQLLDLPFGRASADSHPLQAVDLLAYLTKQTLEPNAYFSRSDGRQLLRLGAGLFARPCPIFGP